MSTDLLFDLTVFVLSLLVGFEVFQGLWWPAWWILLLSFLPWHLLPHLLSRIIGPGSARSIGRIRSRIGGYAMAASSALSRAATAMSSCLLMR